MLFLKGFFSRISSSNSSCKHVGFNHPEIEHRYQKKWFLQTFSQIWWIWDINSFKKLHRLIHTLDGSEIPNNHLGFLEPPLKPCKNVINLPTSTGESRISEPINSTYLPSTFTSAFGRPLLSVCSQGRRAQKIWDHPVGSVWGEGLGRMSIWNFACIVGFGLRGPKIQANSGMHKNQTAKNIPKKGKIILSKKTLWW